MGLDHELTCTNAQRHMPCHMQTAGASLSMADGGSLARIEGPRFKSISVTEFLQIRSCLGVVLGMAVQDGGYHTERLSGWWQRWRR